MRYKTKTLLVVASACAVALAACAETTSDDSVQTRRGAVTVVPEFRLEGTENLPDRLRLHDLGFAISEIQLTPVNPDEGVAYTNRDPLGVDFAVGQGETSRTGRELVLPEAGKYDVSLRLEPVRAQRNQDGAASKNFSFRLSGYVSGNGVVRVDPRSTGENEDGDPIPFPASPKRDDQASSDELVSDKPALPKQWTPFQYQTDKSVVYTLDEVKFAEGRQYLSFSFNAQDWALELVKPLSEAIQHDSRVTNPGGSGRHDVVDVTKEIDRLGEGPEGLADHMSVRAVRPGHGGF